MLAFQLPGPLQTTVQQATHALSSASSAITQTVSSPWILLAGALILLPIFGIFFRPLLFVASAVTQSVSAIMAALVVCASSWCALVIRYIAAAAHMLSPRPIIGWCILACAAAWGLYRSTPVILEALPSITPSMIAVWSLSACLVGGLHLYARSNRHPAMMSQRTVMPFTLAIIAAALLVTVVTYYRADKRDLTACLINGHIDPACISAAHAKRF